jgi:hypothetical protein
MLEPLRLRTAVPVALVPLALPAQAAAHAPGATIALDYQARAGPSARAAGRPRPRPRRGQRPSGARRPRRAPDFDEFVRVRRPLLR